MKHHQLLPHTADTRLRITADSIEELFRGAVEGLSEIMKHGVTKRASDASIATDVDVSANDITAVLVDFLNNLLAKGVIERAVFFDVIKLDIQSTKATASVRGVSVDAFDEDIKAVTYHGAQIQFHKNGTYEVVLVLDI